MRFSWTNEISIHSTSQIKLYQQVITLKSWSTFKEWVTFLSTSTPTTHEPKRPVHAQTTTIKGLLQRFCVFNCASTIFAFVCYVLVSVAAASSSVKHFSSLSKAYLKDACMSYNYVCARFASIVYLTFPFPTSNLHTQGKRSEIVFFEFTNKWLKLLEKKYFS